MDEVLALLRMAEGLAGTAVRARLAAFAPALTIGGGPLNTRTAAAADFHTASGVERRGFARLPNAATATACAPLVAGIERLTKEGLPAMFIYLFDEPWRLGEMLRERVSSLIGARYEVIDDIWAWRIPPGRGRGWPAHRGIAEPLLARGAPELLNTWLALSDVEADRACMHFVPLDDDPSYPRTLACLEAPASATHAAPLSAGDALVWNANALHWGGECDARAKGARVSCSFSLVRADSLATLGVTRAAWDLRARLDTVAQQLLVYGPGQPDVSTRVLMWAKGTVATKAAMSHLFGGGGAP